MGESLRCDTGFTLYAMHANESAAKGTEIGRLETVEVETGPSPDFSVIWLHGLGADGHDFEPVVPYLSDGKTPVRFVFPHAPVRAVTINGGAQMRAWYDLKGFDVRRDQDSAGIEQSASQVDALIRREGERGIPPSRVVVAGFSQGGAIATHVALRYQQRLAGLVAASTYLLFPEQLSSHANPANADLPVFAAHGTHDPVVPFALGEGLANSLRQGGWPVTWRSYPMPHAVCPEEITDIATWMESRWRN